MVYITFVLFLYMNTFNDTAITQEELSQLYQWDGPGGLYISGLFPSSYRRTLLAEVRGGQYRTKTNPETQGSFEYFPFTDETLQPDGKFPGLTQLRDQFSQTIRTHLSSDRAQSEYYPNVGSVIQFPQQSNGTLPHAGYRHERVLHPFFVLDGKVPLLVQAEQCGAVNTVVKAGDGVLFRVDERRPSYTVEQMRKPATVLSLLYIPDPANILDPEAGW